MSNVGKWDSNISITCPDENLAAEVSVDPQESVPSAPSRTVSWAIATVHHGPVERRVPDSLSSDGQSLSMATENCTPSGEDVAGEADVLPLMSTGNGGPRRAGSSP